MAEEEKKVTAKKTATKTTTAKKTTATKATKTTKTTTAKKATTAKTVKATATKTTEKPAVKAEKKVEANEELVARATVKYERMSSRKVAIVANLIRGKNADEAMAILKFTPKAGAEVLTKLLKSAIANAENTKNMTHSKLYVAEIYSNQGPTLKRIRPAAKGSAVRIRKRTSHTTIVLKERV